MTAAGFRSGGMLEEAALRSPMGLDLEGAGSVRGLVRGARATLVYRLDEAEAERRAAAGLGAVRCLQWLDVLLGLPVGLPVPVGSLSGTERRVLARLPPGCVAEADGAVVRLATVPLTVELAVVSHPDWRRGLARAGRFAVCCARAVALAGVPDDLADAQVQAGFHGVGLVVDAARDPVMVTKPETLVGQRCTPAGWLFAEQVYGLGQGR